ncbi:substrate-binding domain-containing protein [Rapidithrix thailandica]|uniref:Substrate-binding domain-containing protein n=1 Tax=Rapidithrix thailandica TaxID=413964 RepID=A0AAW9S8N4_9BACT
MNNKNYTIKDIARLSGVSIGTVDRVLHNRGNVSEKAEQKVKKVLEEIDYQPNLVARTLKKNRVCRFSVLIPDYRKDTYWYQPYLGTQHAAKDLRQFNLSIQEHLFDPSDKGSFKEMAREALSTQPDGFLVAPFFFKESLEFFKECDRQKIPYITFNTHIEEASPLSFIGQNLHKSGRLAAHLLHMNRVALKKLLVLHVEEDVSASRHLQEKEAGFREYFKVLGAEEWVQTLVLGNGSMKEELAKYLHQHEDLSGVFVTSSKAYRVLQSFTKIKKQLVIVGYDLLEKNIEHLKKGEIDYLIHQNPYRQAYLGVSYLFEDLIYKKDIPKEVLLPLDIITSENYEEYLAGQERKGDLK